MKAHILRKVEWKATDEDQKPDVSFMPIMVRRRLSMVERAALHVAWNAFNPEEGEDASLPLPEMGKVPVVFASRWGEIGTTLKLMRQLHSEGEMSPAAFSSSVHNAAPGAWCINFGKKKGMRLVNLLATERNYLRWIVNGAFDTEVRQIVSEFIERGVLPSPPIGAKK